MNDIVGRLKAIVGADYVLSGADEREKYDNDITKLFPGRSMAVVRPGSAEEVSAVLKLANETRTPVVPQAGNTGLNGGAAAGPAGDAVILSVDRLNRILSINPKSRVAKVEAGVILANLHAAVDAHDLVFPLLFGARGSCIMIARGSDLAFLKMCPVGGETFDRAVAEGAPPKSKQRFAGTRKRKQDRAILRNLKPQEGVAGIQSDNRPKAQTRLLLLCSLPGFQSFQLAIPDRQVRLLNLHQPEMLGFLSVLLKEFAELSKLLNP